jgi:hypothetical protein
MLAWRQRQAAKRSPAEERVGAKNGGLVEWRTVASRAPQEGVERTPHQARQSRATR